MNGLDSCYGLHVLKGQLTRALFLKMSSSSSIVSSSQSALSLAACSTNSQPIRNFSIASAASLPPSPSNASGPVRFSKVRSRHLLLTCLKAYMPDLHPGLHLITDPQHIEGAKDCCLEAEFFILKIVSNRKGNLPPSCRVAGSCRSSAGTK